MKCRTDRIPRSAALGDLLRGHLVQICVCPMYVYTVQHSVLLRRPPPGANSLHAIFFFSFFFFFFLLKYELSVEFGSEKYAKTWEFGLRKFNKSRNGQF